MMLLVYAAGLVFFFGALRHVITFCYGCLRLTSPDCCSLSKKVITSKDDRSLRSYIHTR